MFKWGAIAASVCGGWWSAMSGAVSIPLAFLALFFQGQPQIWFAVLAFVGVWVFVIGVIRKHHALVQSHTEEKNRLEKMIESLTVPQIEIQGIPADIATGQYAFCKIQVINKSSNATAENVQVELLSLEDSLDAKEGSYFRPALPFILKPDIVGADTINPGSLLRYNLFRVIMNEGFTREGDAAEMVRHLYFLAYFSQDQTTKDVTRFFWKGDYRIRLRATAKNLSKCEQEFNLIFSENGSFCRFSLTKI
jgi:hypothetical protein